MNEREKFEKWWNEFQSTHEEWRFADRDALLFGAWQVALSTRKAYGYGILDKNGEPYVDDSGMEAHERVDELNNDPESTLAPFRVTELFYEEDK